jgi:hypothetical protein
MDNQKLYQLFSAIKLAESKGIDIPMDRMDPELFGRLIAKSYFLKNEDFIDQLEEE